MSYIKSDRISNTHLLFLFSLSVLLLVIGSLFHIPGIVEKPQYTNCLDMVWLKKIVYKDPALVFGLWGHFILDFIWAPTLLLALWKFVKSVSNTSSLWFAFFAIVSYSLDTVENCRYLNFYSYSEGLEGAKIAFYAVCLLIYLYHLVRKYWSSHWPVLVSFLKSSKYSLLILFVLGSLLPKATQMNSIVVDLYNHPWNMAFLLFFAPIYGAILAHYPSYFKLNQNEKWYQKPYFYLFGIIVYQRSQEKKTDSSNDTKHNRNQESNLNYLWRTLGLFFFTALFYFMAYSSQVNFSWRISVGSIGLLLMGVGLIWLYYVKKRKDKWLNANYPYLHENLPGFYDGDYTGGVVSSAEDEKPADLKYIKKYLNQSIFWFALTIAVNIGLIVFLVNEKENKYTELIVLWSLASIVLQAISYIYYRTFRSVYKLAFFNSSYPTILKSFLKPLSKDGNAKQQVLDFMGSSEFEQNKSQLYKFLSKIGFAVTGSNFTFLQVIATGGILNALFLLIININSHLSFHINSTVIILSYLFLFYGILVITAKHIIYFNFLKTQGASEQKRVIQFRMLLYVSVVALILFNVLAKKFPNDLFTLKPIPKQPNDAKTVEFQDYLNKLPLEQTRYFVGAYGGGMKANAWTMVVLNELHKRDTNFFKKTVVMSGASGGTIGIMNMAAIISEHQNPKKWDSIVREIGTANMLAMDITHLLGRDALNHLFVPGLFEDGLIGRDRASKAMQHYARLSGNDSQNCKPETYWRYWSDLYRQEDHFPILIANTTNIKGNQGMAVSMDIKNPYAHKLLYQGADNILNINSKSLKHKATLSFYDAFSTSNRFPLISPAAKIKTKGQYNDGGIYENSGLLSAFKLFQAANEIEGCSLDSLKQKNVFISIAISKNLYIKKVVGDYMNCLKEIDELSEVEAIINSVAATEMLPIYVKSKINTLSKKHSKIKFETIYLPHLFTVADVKSVLGDKLDCGSGEGATYKKLHQMVEDHNRRLRDHIHQQNKDSLLPVIQPPMSRVIAKQAFDFMVTMTSEDSASASFNKVLSYK